MEGASGRGGKQYQVRVDSLPAELRERLAPPEAERPEDHLLRIAAARSERAWRAAVIERAAQHPPHSRERAAEVRRITAQPTPDHMGRPRTLHRTTVQRWLRKHDERGYAGLARPKRADKGKPRVFISRNLENDVDLPPERWAKIAKALGRHLGGILAAGTSDSEAGHHGYTKLAELLAEAGHPRDVAELRRLGAVPRAFVKPLRKHRRSTLRHRDASQHYDKRLPVTHLDWQRYAPMEVVSGDVTPIDILLERENGRTFTARLIAWVCHRTHMLHADVFFPEEGQGVGAVAVQNSFLNMVENPFFGVPQNIKADNGKEFAWTKGPVGDALRAVCGTNLEFGRGPVHFALPYNSRGKALIEGLFGTFNSDIVSTSAGAIGGNRMKTKKENKGRAPKPYPGSREELRADLATYVAFYNTKPQDGALRGLSPREALNACIAAGWKRIDPPSRAEFELALSTPVTRTVQNGDLITLNGARYQCDALLDPRVEGTVIVRVPPVVNPSHVALLDMREQPIGWAKLFEKTDPFDRAGTRELSRRKKVQRDNDRAMKAERDKVDLVEQRRKAVAAAPPALVPESGGRLGISGALAELGAARPDPAAALPAEPELTPYQLSRRRYLAEHPEERERILADMRRAG